MLEDRTGVPPLPTRRTVLALGLRLGGAAAVVASLAGCGIRLEDDAPRVPGLPTRKPVPGETFLLTLRRHSTDLAAQAKGLGGSTKTVPARLSVLHARQAAVLEAELVHLGVPQTVIDAPVASPTPGATTSTTATPTGSSGSGTTTAAGPKGLAALAASESGDLGPAAVAALAGVGPDTIALAGSLLAQRAAAATLLGAPATWPDPSWSEPSLAASYLEATRAAAYAFEVVAAQSPTGAQRTLAASTLAALQARQSEQEVLAGASATPPALGYPLPFAVTNPAAARTLAVKVLTDLRAAVARELGSTGGDRGPLGAVVQWLAETEVLASRWGVALAPFPGLT
ncbi:DUF4439 domain-containing protein [Pedococcus sp. KACC 23699]|uniref:DUF4439 domain-containing protein n=1 Tax=Pedococcus sp. KACC 23699 TaxID=3149228 RepID=A0AAU7JQS6_9MICO